MIVEIDLGFSTPIIELVAIYLFHGVIRPVLLQLISLLAIFIENPCSSSFLEMMADASSLLLHEDEMDVVSSMGKTFVVNDLWNESLRLLFNRD